MESENAYALWFECSPFVAEQEALARRAARTVLDRHFGPWGVVAAHDAALATGQRYCSNAGQMPGAVSVWLDAIGEAYRAAWAASGLPPLTSELYRDNPQLDDSCVMVGHALPSHAGQEGGLTFRLFDVWIAWSVFEPFDDPSVAHQAREELWARFGSQEAVLEARVACEAAGGLFAPEPQPAAVTTWRHAIRQVLDSTIQSVTQHDQQAERRIREHPDRGRCLLEVGRCRPAEFGGPADAEEVDWRAWWLVDLAGRPQARHACGIAFEVDESVPQLQVRRHVDASADERLEGGWQVQAPSTVIDRLRAQALQLVLEQRVLAPRI